MASDGGGDCSDGGGGGGGGGKSGVAVLFQHEIENGIYSLGDRDGAY